MLIIVGDTSSVKIIAVVTMVVCLAYNMSQKCSRGCCTSFCCSFDSFSSRGFIWYVYTYANVCMTFETSCSM